tara:strand:- start:3951 stop:4313 length:363 start_codon:yes stop_codon:yes gene_type:complete
MGILKQTFKFKKMKIGTKKEQIYKLLLIDKRLRDNDNMLLSIIWRKEVDEIEEAKPKSILSNNLGVLDYLAFGELTSPESIRRTRQKIQQENPNLRGEKYKARHKEQEQVKQELINWNNE